MWLTYEEFVSLGGSLSSVSASEFDFIELKARKRIDYRTLERIKTPTEDIKKLMVELIGLQKEFDGINSAVSSYGNDGVSVSYVSPEAAKADFEAKANELIDSVVGDLAYRGLC